MINSTYFKIHFKGKDEKPRKLGRGRIMLIHK